MKNIIVYIIRGYRKFISPLKPRSCRFYPSCSEYAAEAIEKCGICQGIVKSVWRLLRCNPFSRGGYDPVTKEGNKTKGIV